MRQNERYLVPHGASLYEAGICGPQEVMETVTGRMLETRPRLEVKLTPYMELPFFHQEPLSGPACLDFDAAYPEQESAAIAWAAAWLMASWQEEAVFSFQGEARGIWLNGERIYGRGTSDDGRVLRKEWDCTIIPVLLYAGRNELLIQCEKGDKGWGIRYVVSHPRYWTMWARDYLLNVRVTLPFAQMEGMEGMACIGPFPKDTVTDDPVTIRYGPGGSCLWLDLLPYGRGGGVPGRGGRSRPIHPLDRWSRKGLRQPDLLSGKWKWTGKADFDKM